MIYPLGYKTLVIENPSREEKFEITKKLATNFKASLEHDMLPDDITKC